jgi:hypothetical protein
MLTCPAATRSTSARVSFPPGPAPHLQKTPLLGSYLILSAWLQFIGTALVLIGSAIFFGNNLDTTSAGAILWFIGFGIWALASFIIYSVNQMVNGMTVIMPSMSQRYMSWHASMSTLAVTIALIFFVLGSVRAAG